MTWERTGSVLSVLLSLPIVAVWAFAVYDLVRRGDIPVVRKVVLGALVVVVVPVALLYLLSRPTSLVRHRERAADDWREDLVDRLEARPGDPPVLGPREEERLRELVRSLGPPPLPPGSTGPDHRTGSGVVGGRGGAAGTAGS